MKTPDDEQLQDDDVKDGPVVNDEPVIDDDVPPAPTEEPGIVSFSDADFNAMLGRHDDLVLHVVIGDGDDDDCDRRVRVRVGRYVRRDP